MNPNILQTVGPTICVALMFAVFRMVVPTRLAPVSPEEMRRLGRIYTKWSLLVGVLMVLYIPAAGYGWYRLLCRFAPPGGPAGPARGFLLVPDSINLALPSGVLGLFTSVPPIWLTFRVLLGRRYEEYMRWDELRFGFNGWIPLALMAIVMIPASAAAIRVIRNTSTRFGPEGIVVRGHLSPEPTVYPYRRVRAIARVAPVKARSGAVANRPSLAIRFDDGYTWWTSRRLDVLRADESRDRKIIALVSALSGVAARDVDLIDELDH